MTRRLLVVLALTACSKVEVSPPAPPPAPAPARAPASKAVARATVDAVTPGTAPSSVQVRVGGGDVDEQPKLAFEITRVYDKQQALERAPWHKDGGAWLFFDAQTEGAAPATFTFGITSSAASNSPFAFGEGVLLTTDRAQADRFLAQFGKAFHQPVPAHPTRPGGPLKLKLAVLGRDLGRSPGGGYGGKGDWIATKLFPQKPSLEGEVFFNFSIGAKKGELAEKDADYNKDVMAVFAQSL